MRQPAPPATSTVTFIDLEFDTAGGAPLGDIAASLVSLHDLLRDLAAIAAAPTGAEFREVQVVAIEMRNPLTIKLSLLAISAEAIKAFQEICRDIIARRPADVHAALEVIRQDVDDGGIAEREVERLQAHILTLINAEVGLKRVVVAPARSDEAGSRAAARP